jgi:Hypothetical glycosyl hydrolase 6/Beta-galactosidase trimerisation domain
MDSTRREFALLAGTLLAAPAAFAEAAVARPAPESSGTPWYRQIQRIVQINFNERDPLTFDVETWADYLGSARAQATYLSITNVVAFYPSKLPDLPLSPFLGSRDLFGECVHALRKRNIRIVGRLSIDVAQTRLAIAHPEWFRRTANDALVIPTIGTDPEDPASSADYAATCQFSSYYTDFVPALIQEITSRYDIDGIYSNGWPGTEIPPCYCQLCRQTGTPGSHEYRRAYQQRASELWKRYAELVAQRKSTMVFSGNLGGGLRGGDLDLVELAAMAPWFMADNQGRGDVGAPTWDASQQTRIGLALARGKPLFNVTAAYEMTGAHRWRNVSGNAAEVRSRLFQTAAAGGVLYYHWLGYQQGFREDRRWQAVGREVLRWHAEHEVHFRNIASLATVALVVSPRSNRLYQAPPGTDPLDSLQGMYLLLNEARIPFDIILDSELSARNVARYSVLVLPNVAVLGDEQARVIADFAASGGSLLSTFETGLYDLDGRPRTDLVLGTLYLTRRTGARQGYGNAAGRKPGFAGSSSIQRLGTAHPITAGFHDTDWIQGSSWRVPIQADGDALLTHVPQYPWYPTEAVYSREPVTNVPTAIARSTGRSRRVYLAEDVDAGYWRTGAGDLGDLVLGALHWLTEDRIAVQVKGDGLLEIHAWQTDVGYAIHLLNFTNPNFRAGALRHNYAVGPQHLRLQLPPAQLVRKVSLLRTGIDLEWTISNTIVEVIVPGVRDYEVVALWT